jgi:hypothetical protein
MLRRSRRAASDAMPRIQPRWYRAGLVARTKTKRALVHKVEEGQVRGRIGILVLVLIAGLTSGPARCTAAEGDDSLAIEPLRLQLEGRSLARVTGPWGAARLSNPRIKSAGLEFLLATPDVPGAAIASLPSPIPMAQIAEVEVPFSYSGRTAIGLGLIGAVIGVAGASAMSNLSGILGPSRPASSGELLTGAMAGAVPGALLGALLGSMGRGWKVVYKKSELQDHRSP